MGTVHDTSLFVIESAEEVREPHGPKSDIRQRNDHRAVALEEVEIRPQNDQRPRKMFEDIGENDGVEASPVQRVAHFVDLREVHLDHLLDAPPRHDHRIAARVDPHHTIAAALDVMRRGGEAACDVEHVAAAALAPETEETPVDVLEVSVLLRFKHRAARGPSRSPSPHTRRC